MSATLNTADQPQTQTALDPLCESTETQDQILFDNLLRVARAVRAVLTTGQAQNSYSTKSIGAKRAPYTQILRMPVEDLTFLKTLLDSQSSPEEDPSTARQALTLEWESWTFPTETTGVRATYVQPPKGTSPDFLVYQETKGFIFYLSTLKFGAGLRPSWNWPEASTDELAV